MAGSWEESKMKFQVRYNLSFERGDFLQARQIILMREDFDTLSLAKAFVQRLRRKAKTLNKKYTVTINGIYSRGKQVM